MKLVGWIGVFLCTGLMAGELPQLPKKPWLGCFAGHEGRGFDYSLRSDGKAEISFKRGSKRISPATNFKVDFVLEEEVDGKWVSRQIQEDEFETADEASDKPEKITFAATYTGDTKVEITHEFDRSGVLIGCRILEKTTTNKIRCGIRVVVADLYRSLEDAGLDERDLRKKVDAEITGLRLDGEDVKVDLYKKPQLDEADYFPNGARRFTFECEKIAGRELILETAQEKAGLIEIRQTKTAYNGFNLHWWPDPAEVGTPGARLRLQVK